MGGPDPSIPPVATPLPTLLAICYTNNISICSSCFFHIRDFRHIRPNLTPDMEKSVEVSLISSRLDYCNSLLYYMYYMYYMYIICICILYVYVLYVLYGSSQANIHKLQRVQNVNAKLVCGTVLVMLARPMLFAVYTGFPSINANKLNLLL